MLAVILIVSLLLLIKLLAITPCLLVTLGTTQALRGLCGERDEARSIPRAYKTILMWMRACWEPRSAKQEILGNKPELAGYATIA
jgi:hypothetical protein